MLKFFQRFLRHFQKEEAIEDIQEEAPKKSFFLYITMVPKILTYFRRERGIAKKYLELVLIDNEEQPAYQVVEIVESLMEDLNFLYLVTGRADYFEDAIEEALEEYGLLVVVLPEVKEPMPGNLILDTRDWENHLDIITPISYNTMINETSARLVSH